MSIADQQELDHIDFALPRMSVISSTTRTSTGLAVSPGPTVVVGTASKLTVTVLLATQATVADGGVDFDDGSTLDLGSVTDATAKHTYATAGTYNATVRATTGVGEVLIVSTALKVVSG